MTVQEAIKHLKEITHWTNFWGGSYNDKLLAIDMAIKALEKYSNLECVIKRLEDNSFWTEATFDEDGYCNDDSETVIGLGVAIEIIKEELM